MHGKVPIGKKPTQNLTYKFCSFCGRAHQILPEGDIGFYTVEGTGGVPCNYFCDGGDCEKKYNQSLAKKLPTERPEWVYDI